MATEFNGVVYDDVHGGPFDRGSADSWYSRGAIPHWYPEGSYRGEIVTQERMTLEQIQAYHAGYEWNEKNGGKKDWN